VDQTHAPDPPPPPPGGGPRILFLDDDPERAYAFLEVRPDAVWVQTVEECLGRLEEPWDEVYLDHDLGGEIFVDLNRDDCGMAVVRWLCLTPREHLKATRFVVHSHNESAAWLMVMQMQAVGFVARACPFGDEVLQVSPPIAPGGWRRRVHEVLRWLRGSGAPPPAPPSVADPEGQGMIASPSTAPPTVGERGPGPGRP
jgi:hypothetical protein